MGSEKQEIVDPVDPNRCRELDGIEVSPWPTPMVTSACVKAVDRLGESVVVGISDAADRELDSGIGQALGVADADFLKPCRNAAMNGPPFLQGLFESIETKLAWAVRLTCRPAMRWV
jgi:hypothetical protein